MTDPIRPLLTRESLALVRILEHHGITVVLDVGANVGQYATRLRHGGWDGRIVSFEPLPAAHAALSAAAADDPAWEIAPPVALGAEAGTVALNISAESDMSSVLPFRPEMAELLDSAAFTDRATVPQERLDTLFDRQYSRRDWWRGSGCWRAGCGRWRTRRNGRQRRRIPPHRRIR
jgi:FkbM family methyltransferase